MKRRRYPDKPQPCVYEALHRAAPDDDTVSTPEFEAEFDTIKRMRELDEDAQGRPIG